MAVDSDDGRRNGIGEVVAVLDALIGRQSPWGVRELAEHTGSTRSSTNRILLALVDARLARQDDRAQYGVGPRLLVIARALHRSHPLFALGQTLLDEVRDARGATATLSVSSAGGRLPTALVVSEPVAAMRFTVAPGAPLALGDDATALDATAFDAARGGSAPISIAVPFASAASASAASASAASASAASMRADVVVALSTPRTEYSAADLEASLADLERVAARLRVELSTAMNDASTPTGRPAHPAPTFVARVDRLVTRLATTPFTRGSTRDLATAIGAGVAATTSLLATARSTGLLGDADRTDISEPGSTLLRWAASLGGDATDGRLVLDDLRALAAETGETAGFATFDGTTAHVAGTAPGRETVRYVSDGTPEVSLHAGSSGKAILAEAPWLVDEIELEAFTAETITERDALLAELDGIRSRGWALGEGERFHDAFGIAAPVFTDGVVSGSVNVTIPRHRVDRSLIDELAAAVMATADRISALLTTAVR